MIPIGRDIGNDLEIEKNGVNRPNVVEIEITKIDTTRDMTIDITGKWYKMVVFHLCF